MKRRIIEWKRPKRDCTDRPDFQEDALVWVAVVPFDRAWSHDIDYLGHAGTGRAINGRYEKIGKFIESGEPVEMPEVSLKNGVLGFTNGRHRFAWLRDHGATAILVLVPPDQALAMIDRFGTSCRQTIVFPPPEATTKPTLGKA